MKQILLILIFVSINSISFAQKAVFDISCVETLIANHKVQHTSFTNMKNREIEMSALQRQIASKMTQIEYFQSVFYNSLKSVEAIVKTGKDIIYCTDIAKDIGKYQKKMLELAADQPSLVLVAAKTELELVNRTSDLTQFIYQTIIVGTDVNLMDNKQRLDLLKHVILELRQMRGLAYSVCRQMKTARRNGVMETLAPGFFRYKDNRSKIVKDVLGDFKVNSR